MTAPAPRHAAAARAGIAAGLALALAACASVAPPAPHPLDERIVRSQDATLVEADVLFAAAAEADVVLIGEKHDNARHHALEQRLLRELIARGREPVLGLEMADTGQSAALMRYVSAGGGPHAAANPRARLRADLGWGADDWRLEAYGPLLDSAREHGLSVFGADLPVALRRRIASAGIDGLSGMERALLPPTPPPEPAYLELTRERIRAAHCGHGSDEYLDRLLANWTARNETMARAVAVALEAGDGVPVVLVVGWGHLRNERGVVERIRRLRPEASVFSLGLRETHPERATPQAYVEALDAGGTRFPPDHPYVWLTAPARAATGGDPCAAFKRGG